MDAIGQQLKAAREKKRVSLSQAAAKTHIKIQHLEAIEREDFGRIPAPTYVKGFIKMYAEFLDVDAAPLVKAYVDRHAPKTRPSIMPEEPKPLEDASLSVPRNLPWRTWLESARKRIAAVKVPWRKVAVTAVVLLVLGAAVVGLQRWLRHAREVQPVTTVVETARPVRRTALAVAQEPREPYIEINAPAPSP